MPRDTPTEMRNAANIAQDNLQALIKQLEAFDRLPNVTPDHHLARDVAWSDLMTFARSLRDQWAP